jgi:hypothetical protein
MGAEGRRQIEIERVRSEKEFTKTEKETQLSKKTITKQGSSKFDCGNNQTACINNKRVEDS